MKTRAVVSMGAIATLACGAVACWWACRPERGYERLIEASADFDQTRLAQMSETADLERYYETWLRTHMQDLLEAAPEVTELGLVEAILQRNESEFKTLASAYASPAGIRALIEKCDPREQSDEARSKAPDVDRKVRVVGWSAVEVSCQAPGGETASYDLERSGINAWKIVRVRLPRDLGESLSQRAAGAD